MRFIVCVMPWLVVIILGEPAAYRAAFLADESLETCRCFADKNHCDSAPTHRLGHWLAVEGLISDRPMDHQG
ncbi:hypothetical protein ACLM45_00905 [Synechococcus sp. A10-1-5-9]|uniref:hypothetical protein n=1 Tax=Synechococcus sp. A10-1-5-9 TaxID=3392295 RepID=UPI0039ED95D6